MPVTPLPLLLPAVDLSDVEQATEQAGHDLEQALLPLFLYCEKTQGRPELSEYQFKHLNLIRAALEWNKPANSGDFRLRLNGSTLYMPGAALTYTITGLAPDTDSSVEVQALTNGNYAQSAYSAAVTARTAAAGPLPTITNFSPATAGIGGTTRVTGTNLAGVTAASINGVAVTMRTNNTTAGITLTVPVGATTGKISLTTANGTVVSVQDFVVQQASNQLVIPLTANKLLFNTLDQSYSSPNGTVKRYSVFSEYAEDTDATTAIFKVRTTLRGQLGVLPVTEAAVGIYLDNQFLQALTPDQDGVAQDFTVALPGSGIRRLRVVNGAASRSGDAGDIYGSTIEQITFPAGTTHTPIMWVKQPKQLLWFSDSIESGIGSTKPTSKATAMLLRQQFPDWDITLMDSYGSKRAVTAFGTPAACEAAMVQVRLLFGSATTRRIFIALGINDYTISTPAEVAAAIGAFCDAVYAEFPDAVITVATPIITTKEADVEPYRAALRALAPSHVNVKILDMQYALSPDRITQDGVHPDDLGHEQQAEFVGVAVLDGDVGSPIAPAGFIGAVAPVMVEDDSPNYVQRSAGWTVIYDPTLRDGHANFILSFTSDAVQSTYSFWARGIRHFADTYFNQYKGPVKITINGQVFYANQQVVNPKPDSKSWPYFAPPLTRWKQYAVTIQAAAGATYASTDDGMEGVDGTGVFVAS
jgi:lysophospholipase L1-like esterase